MQDRPPTIVAMGGGGFSMDSTPLMDDFVLSLTGKSTPRVCFLATASGDSSRYYQYFYDALTYPRAIPSHLQLFVRPRAGDPREHLLQQDVIYVGGGNTANALAIWRLHGIDVALREAWRAGVVLCGVSAGMICWFESSITDSFGTLQPLHDGLGFLPGSACPHFDGEGDRRPTYHRALAEGLANGIAADDGAAAVFRGTELVDAVASRPGAKVYRVRSEAGSVTEEVVPTRYLGD